MQKPVIVGLGELLWDVFPEYKRAGGAPANVAYHATQLGNHGIPASRIGNDDIGTELLAILSSRSIDTTCIQIDEQAPTGTVEITIKNDEASYSIPEDVAWDRLTFSPEWIDLARNADAVCFGTLAQRSEVSKKTIRAFLSETNRNCLKIADINLRAPYYSNEVVNTTLDIADVVKLNNNEWQEIKQIFKIHNMKTWLFNEKNVKIICLTKGIEGAEIITPEQHLIEPVHPVDNAEGDSVGVGDAFTAALAHHLLRNSSLDVGITAANRYASQIAARKGAMPKLPAAVIDSIIRTYKKA